MAKNVYSLQLLRNTQIFADKETAISGITSAPTQDGVIKLARYTEGDETKTIFGIYHDFGGGNAGYTIYDSYQEVIDAIQEKISGSTEDIDKIKATLGNGVGSGAGETVTDQLEALSGDSSTAQSGDTSVEGAKKYADEKVADAVAGLDATITADTGYYINKVDEVNGKISGTTAALPTVAAIGEAGKPITAVSESLGAVSATAGTINAEFVNVTGNTFSSSTVQAALEEIETEYKAADAAIVGNASESANTLAKLEGIVNDLSADAKEYSIKQITTGLSTNVKEAWGLFDADDHQSGATISIYKDSAYKEIYLGTSADTINTTTGEITKQEGDKQSLNYAYMKADGTYDLVKVDVSAFISESEFASGVTATDHIVHGVVDSTSEKDSQSTPVDFLTVGANGFKVSGIKDEIDRKIAALDATVGEASVATGNHVAVQVVEAGGVLTALTVSEDNIANADDLAALSAKTVTEIASSNSSITVATAATTAADGTVKYDVITDASKIKMSGFTAAPSGFTGITEDSSVSGAIKAIETAYIATNAELDKKIEKVVVNGVTGTVANHIQDLTIDGADIKLDGYTSGSSSDAVVATDTVNQAIGKLENQIKNAVAGGLQKVEAGSGITVSTVADNKQTIDVKLAAVADIPNRVEENAIKFDATNKGLYIDTLDCGTY